MKTFLYSVLAGALLLAGCTKDNVKPPSSQLSGRIVYQDQALGVRNNGSTDIGGTTSMLELWQPGYAFFVKIPLFVQQDGTFTAELFNGDYKLVRSRGNGPWVDNTDSIDVQVRGNTVIDVPVQPYFTIQNATFQRSGATVTATCSVTKVATKDIDVATLFLSSTAIVDAANSVAKDEKKGADVVDLSKPLSFSKAVPAAIKGAVYARIGVKAAGVGEYVYSPVQKLE